SLNDASPVMLAEAYNAAIQAGRLRPDEAQVEVIALLSQLQQAWGREMAQRPLIKRVFSRRNRASGLPQGVYLWGDVGRGKSLLMDLFFETVAIHPKRRVHFHAFMQDVHARIHLWRQAGHDGASKTDPIPPLATALAAEARLLCLDEF